MTARTLRPAPETEPLIGVSALANHLDVPVQTIYHWRKHGRGPKGYRVGREVKFRLTEVETWLQQHAS